MVQVPVDNRVRVCNLVKIIDGDTLRLNIDLGWTIHLTEGVRLLGLDTPEPRGVEAPAGKFVTRQVTAFFGDSTEVTISSDRFSVGKYGRTIARVWVNDRCLNNWILDSGLAWPTDDSGRIIGARSLDRLNLPEGIRQRCRENLA